MDLPFSFRLFHRFANFLFFFTITQTLPFSLICGIGFSRICLFPSLLFMRPLSIIPKKIRDKIINFQLTGLDLNSLTGKRRTCKKAPAILCLLSKIFSNEKGERKMLMKLTPVQTNFSYERCFFMYTS